jgi:benzoylformate decarboxylase
MTAPVAPRTVAREFAPDPAMLAALAEAIITSNNPAIVVGAAVDRDGAFELAVQLAERVNATVWEAPASCRASFPEDHPLFAGFLPAIPERLSHLLRSHDVIVVVGAPVFTFHVAGDADIFRSSASIYQIIDDPVAAARAPNTTTILGTMKLSLVALLELLPRSTRARPAPRPARPAVRGRDPMPIDFVMQAIADATTSDTIVVEEAPSHRPAMQRFLPIRRSGGFYTMASGGLGYGLPAAVGVALAERRRVVCLVGDGSAMYSIQALWTAVQHALPLTVIVLNNRGYGALKTFSAMMGTSNVPGMELPGIDFPSLATAFGCKSVLAGRAQDLADALSRALQERGPMLLEIVVDPDTGAVY